jgi:hypothetical protein
VNADAILNFLLIACAAYTALYLAVGAFIVAYRFTHRILSPALRRPSTVPPLAVVVPLRRGVATSSGSDPAGATSRNLSPRGPA